MEEKLRVAVVTWQDCESEQGWMDRLELEEYIQRPLSVMKSVGWLLHNGEDWVVLAQSVGTHNGADLVKIPRAMIQDVQVLADLPEGPEAIRSYAMSLNGREDATTY